MALKSYILTQNFKSPCVQVTGVPHAPQAIRFKTFLKNEIIQGELKHSNNQPAFVLVGGKLVVPLSVLKEVVAKDITSSASGETTSASSEPKKIKLPSISKVKYIDAVVVGALLGVGSVVLAEKQKWIPMPDKKNKLIGAAIGVGAACYALYRYKTFKSEKSKEKE